MRNYISSFFLRSACSRSKSRSIGCDFLSELPGSELSTTGLGISEKELYGRICTGSCQRDSCIDDSASDSCLRWQLRACGKNSVGVNVVRQFSQNRSVATLRVLTEMSTFFEGRLSLWR